jgi:hypothetical protein
MMSDEKLTKCEQVPNSPNFDCHFELMMQTNIPSDSTVGSIDPNIMQGFQMASNMENKALEDNAHEDHQAIIRLTEEGWQAPDIRGGMDIFNSMGDAMQRAIRETH